MPRGYRMGLLLLGDSPSVPDGSTITPINDVPTWLKCAGIPTTTYTTLSEVLADTSLLRMLINSENAMDYLVRCKAWIGLGLVPKMTSNTTPSGEVFASVATTNYPAWYTFDKNTSTKYVAIDAGSSVSIGYHFADSICVKKLSWRANIDSPFLPPTSIQLQGSNDNSTWNNIGDIISNITQDSDEHSQIYNNNDSYSYYRLICTSRAYNNHQYVQFSELQFYDTIEEGIADSQSAMQFIGANDYASNLLLSDEDWLEGICNSEYFEDVLNVKVPTMTSNTTPNGECFGISKLLGDYYQAFNGNDSDYIQCSSGQSGSGNGEYVGYTFTSPVKIAKVSYKGFGYSAPSDIYYVKFQGSNDNFTSDIIDLSEAVTCTNNVFSDITLTINISNYKSARVIMVNSNATTLGVYTLQFFGRAIDNSGVQSWLLAAGITNKNYTTVSQVLADSDLLPVLIASHSGMDYLATCVAFASEICANENAMQLIGADNYAADTLLSNETWLNAICNSTYFESVLNVKVPTMTSNTTPSGVVSSSSVYNSQPQYYAYQSLSGNSSNTALLSGTSGTWGYQFTGPVKVYKFITKEYGNSGTVATTSMFKDATIQASNDGNIWTNVSTIANTDNTAGKQYTYVFNPSNDYEYYRINITTNFGSTLYTQIGVLSQFYGRVDV